MKTYASNFLNDSVIFSGTFSSSTPSISNTSAGTCGDERSDSIVSFVALTMVVMNMRGPNQVLKRLKGVYHTRSHVRVPNIETHSDISEVRGVQQLHQAFGRRQIVGDILHHHLHAQRLRKCAQMLQRCHGGFNLLSARALAAYANMLHQKLKRGMFGDFDGPLDLVHCGNSVAFFYRRDI